jgi:CHAD domain-containing protein
MTTLIDYETQAECLRQRLTGVLETLETLANRKSGHSKSSTREKEGQSASKADASGTSGKLSKSQLVHDLRVACRRGETALSALDFRSESVESIWLQNRMHRLRKSCNPLRDDEVLLKWLKKQPLTDSQQKLAKFLSKSIKDAYPAAIERLQKTVQPHRFQQHIRRLSPLHDETKKHVENGHADQSERLAMDWAIYPRRLLGRWLFHVLECLIHQFPDDDTEDFDALHQLRIGAKRLRYSMEFAQELDPKLKLQGSIGCLEEMQGKLGELHDSVVREERLKKEFAQSRHGGELVAVARDALQNSLAEWRAWWQPVIWKQLLRQSTAEVSKLLT